MTDSPFGEFQNSPTPLPAVAEEVSTQAKKARNRRKPREVAAKSAKTTTPKTQGRYKSGKRRPKIEVARAPNGKAAVPVDLQLFFAGRGLKDSEANLFGQIVQAIQEQPKGSRGRIAAALGKAFS